MTRLTPSRQQYLDFKSQFPDSIVMFRLGDFYEMFDDDAQTAARELDLVLTGRPVSKGERVPMCGVPYHAVEGYIARLVERGYHVAVVEQVGSEPVNGLTPREVSRVITPGTVMEPGMLADARHIVQADITTRAGGWENWNHAKGLGAPYEKVKDAIAFKNDPSKQSMHHARQKEEMGLQKVDVAYNPNYVVALEVDRDGVVWVGTWGGGLSRYDGRAWKSYTTHEGLPGNHVFMLHLDPRGRLWAGTNNGLARMKDGRFEVMTVADGLFADNVFSMTTARDGSIWVGSFGGVAHIREGAFK